MKYCVLVLVLIIPNVDGVDMIENVDGMDMIENVDGMEVIENADGMEVIKNVDGMEVIAKVDRMGVLGEPSPSIFPFSSFLTFYFSLPPSFSYSLIPFNLS
jgi:hypothetical protein